MNEILPTLRWTAVLAVSAVVGGAAVLGAAGPAGLGAVLVLLALRWWLPPGPLAGAVRFLGRHRAVARAPDPDALVAMATLARRWGRDAPHLIVVEGDRVEARAIAGGGGDVVLVSEAVERLEPSERDAVLAHELGHLVGAHPALAIGSTLAAVLALIASVVVALGDPSALERLTAVGVAPGVASGGFLVAASALGALRVWLVPRLEHEADAIAAECLDDPAPLVAALGRRRGELGSGAARRDVDERVRRLENRIG